MIFIHGGIYDFYGVFKNPLNDLFVPCCGLIFMIPLRIMASMCLVTRFGLRITILNNLGLSGFCDERLEMCPVLKRVQDGGG